MHSPFPPVGPMVITTLLASTLLGSVIVAAPVAGEETQSASLADAIAAGKAGFDLRARYEFVDDDNPALTEDANALTAKLRLNYRTAAWQRISAFVEFDHVLHVVDDFNSGGGTSPGKTSYPVVADPSGPDLNQLYLDIGLATDWTLRAGRQRILLDNQRFVGGVGWRQNEQTYDGLTLAGRLAPAIGLSYTYANRVRRIFGDDVPAGRARADIHLLHASAGLGDDWTLSPYFYHLDYDETANAANSTSTAGLRLAGKFPAAGRPVALALDYARQTDAGGNPVDYDADYALAELHWNATDVVGIGGGFERLSGDASTPGAAFRTPLATLHKFQGWADKFLATPGAGIDDLYLTVTVNAGGWKLAGNWHEFEAEDGGVDYGSELDISASRSLGNSTAVLVKAAFFDADSPAFSDTTRLWLQFTWAWKQ